MYDLLCGFADGLPRVPGAVQLHGAPAEGSAMRPLVLSQVSAAVSQQDVSA